MNRIIGARMHFFDPELMREVECIVEDINGSMAYVRDEKDEFYWIDRRDLHGRIKIDKFNEDGSAY